MYMHIFARYLIMTGSVLLSVGIMLLLAAKAGYSWHMPGDIIIKRHNYTVYFPVMTSLLLSVILSAIIYFFSHKR